MFFMTVRLKSRTNELLIIRYIFIKIYIYNILYITVYTNTDLGAFLIPASLYTRRLPIVANQDPQSLELRGDVKIQ